MHNGRHRYLHFGEFRLDTYECALTREGEIVPLTSRCYELLLTFVSNSGHLLTHDELMHSVWDSTTVDRSSLKQTVATLRRILGDPHEQPRYIQTVPKFGYRFVADVTTDDSESVVVVSERQTLTLVDVEELTETSVAFHKAVRTHPKLVAALGVLVLVTIAVAISWLPSLRARFALASSAVPSFENLTWRKLTTSGDVAFAVASPNAQFVAYVAFTEDGKESLRLLSVADSSELTLVPAALATYWSVAFTNDGSQIYFVTWNHNEVPAQGVLYRVSTLGGKVQKVLTDTSGGVKFSPDGNRFLFSRTYRSENRTAVMTANTGDGSDERLVANSPADNPMVATGWSPDGLRILYLARQKRDDGFYSYLGEMPASGGNETILSEPRKQRFLSAAWTDSGSGILVGATSPDTKALQIFYVSYPDGKFTRLTNDLNNYFFPNLSSDGGTIVATQQEASSDVWIADGEGVGPRKISNKRSGYETLSWTADGHVACDTRENGRFHVWTIDPDGGDQLQITADQFEAKRPAVSPDGRLLTFLSNRAGPWQIWRSRTDGTEAEQVTSSNEMIADEHFAGQGSEILFQRYLDGFWTLASVSAQGGEPTTLVGNTNVGVWNVSPDGSMLAYFVDDDGDDKPGYLVVRSLLDANKVIYPSITPSDFIAFTPDNRALITKQRTDSDAPQATIWQIPLSGGKPRKLVSNPPDDIHSAAFSPDGKRLAWIQGRTISDIVLLTRN